MVRYALLLAPSANRVYAASAARLSRAELAAFGAVTSVPPEGIEEIELGGVRYLGFTAAGAGLTPADVACLANLSAGYALFELIDGGLLRPVRWAPLGRFDDDLITIPKYAGKTNEQFTQLLFNVTLLASDRTGALLTGGLTVLDPLCGRGTTLNQALMYGHHAIGIEQDGKDVDAYAAFLRTWLRRKRIKHSADLHPVRRDRRLVARCFEATVAATPDDHRAGTTQRVTVYHADTASAREFLRAGCADLIVTDAPYGVVHGSRTAAQGLSRRPLELLRGAVPVWSQLLRPGGALGLSWNVQVTDRAAAEQVLAGAGLEVVRAQDYLSLEHWVDQSITRDVLVARKPR